jgi:predicted DNA-binding protein (MmcQ/YjbR family)
VPKQIAKIHKSLREFALTLPESWEDTPWGDDLVVKVRKKIFVFLGSGAADPVRISVKLPESAEHALSLPDAVPTSYGLGRSGWVTLKLAADTTPLDLLIDWVEESYRAVAPKTLVAKLPAGTDQTG